METATITTKACVFCGKKSTIEVTDVQARAYAAGMPAQDIWPDMPLAEREVLISGTHEKCWPF